MDLVEVVWVNGEGEQTTLLRDARAQGRFLVGIECNEWGVGHREGCTEEPALMIHQDRIRTVTPVEARRSSADV